MSKRDTDDLELWLEVRLYRVGKLEETIIARDSIEAKGLTIELLNRLDRFTHNDNIVVIAHAKEPKPDTVTITINVPNKLPGQ